MRYYLSNMWTSDSERETDHEREEENVCSPFLLPIHGGIIVAFSHRDILYKKK